MSEYCKNCKELADKLSELEAQIAAGELVPLNVICLCNNGVPFDESVHKGMVALRQFAAEAAKKVHK